MGTAEHRLHCAGQWNVLGDHFLTEWHCKKEMHFLPAAFFLEMQFIFSHLRSHCVRLFPKALEADIWSGCTAQEQEVGAGLVRVSQSRSESCV